MTSKQTNGQLRQFGQRYRPIYSERSTSELYWEGAQLSSSSSGKSIFHPRIKCVRKMALSISSLTSSISSLSFSSNVISKPQNLHFACAKSFPIPHVAKINSLVVVASSAAAAVGSPSESEITDLEKYVKSRLPGGFAAQSIFGTGRRKCAIARVVLQEGSGKFIINHRDAKEYLQGNPLWLQYIKFPLVTLGYETSYDVFVKAHGGGLAGQAQAISLGIARALLKVSESHREPLRKEGLLTRDSRVVERKKAGLKKARKAPQFSKR
ncbi:30S ribosomal protein S9, chloroplastic [Ancistrocladus abbreviatus]